MKYTLNFSDVRSIKELPKTERPREKLCSKGSLSLSDHELMCLILGSGIKNFPVQEIAWDILNLVSRKNGEVSYSDLTAINGLGDAKAALVCASLELGRRLGRGMNKHISGSDGIWQQIRHYGDRPQEYFLSIILNGALEVMAVKVVSVGLVNKTLVHPRELFSEAIKLHATAIVIAHNHPSGNLEPSVEDIQVTEIIRKSGKLLGIELLDHIIFSSDNYRSLKETGEFWAD